MVARYILLHLVGLAAAVPDVAFPFNSQLPPVARVGQAYQFIFSPTTFRPNGETFQYSLAGAPAWLNLDAPSRTLSGTPGSADVGSPTFTISAADGAGKTSMQATLVVVPYDGPKKGTNMTDSLAKAGKMCGPYSVTFSPGTSFMVSFPSSTFMENGKPILSYYATLSDHTPLPGWLSFDSDALHFAGTTPPLSASPQHFEVLLIASDVVGFAGVWTTFTVVVSDHQFYFQNVETSVDVETGDSVNINDLRAQLVLDGKPISEGDFAGAESDALVGLTFQPQALSLTGVPTSAAKGQDITVTAHDRFGDTASMKIHLHAISGLFKGEFGTINATAGKELNYTFSKSAFTQTGLTVTVDLGSASKWLQFDTTALNLHGEIPANTPTQTIAGELNASLPDGSLSGSQSFKIQVHAAQVPTSTHSTRSSNESSPASSTGGVFAATGAPQNKTSAKITVGVIVGVVIIIVAAIIILVLALIYCRSPRHGLNRTRSAFKRTISRPVPPSHDPWIVHNMSAEMEQEEADLEKGSEEYDRTPDAPPQIVLSHFCSPGKHARSSARLGYTTISEVKPDCDPTADINRISVASSTINDGEALVLDNINRTSWGYMGAAANKRSHDSMRLAAQMARASRQLDSFNSTPTRAQRISRHLSNNRMSPALARRNSAMRVTSGGLPANPRLVGLGHGRSPPAANGNSLLGILQMQQQNQRAPSYAESCSTYSTGPISPFPLPSGSHSHLSRKSSQLGSHQRSNVRDSMLLDPRRTSQQRPIPRRTNQRSAFFSGGPSSRGSSSSRHRSAVLGLSTIHGSPDLDVDSPAAESSDALARGNSNGTSNGAESSTYGANAGPGSMHPLHRNPTHSLHRNPTQTSSKTAKTWQTSTTVTTTESSPISVALPDNALPPIPPRNPAHVHKRLSTNLLRPRLSRPPSGPAMQDPLPNIRDSILFASADENNMASSSEDEEEASAATRATRGRRGNRITSSLYSQSSMTSPKKTRPPTRGKIPIGGIRVPPFSSPDSGNGSGSGSIMARPHPRASFRKLSDMGTSAIRAPLRSVRGGENRNSGSGFSSGKVGKDAQGGADGDSGAGGESKGGLGNLLRPRLRSSRGKRPVSVETGGERTGLSLRGRVERERDGSDGGAAFL